MKMYMRGWPMMSACCTTGLGSTVRSMGENGAPAIMPGAPQNTKKEQCLVLHALPGPRLSGSPPPPPPPPPPAIACGVATFGSVRGNFGSTAGMPVLPSARMPVPLSCSTTGTEQGSKASRGLGLRANLVLRMGCTWRCCWGRRRKNRDLMPGRTCR